MDSSVLRDRVVDLLAPVLAADGLDLEDAQLAQAGRRRMLRIIVDADGGVDLDQLADTSRAVARALDDSDLMGAGSYTLEVTSRGVDRPLIAERHWRRNTGRLVKVTFADGRKITGRILGSDVSGADVDVDGRPTRVAYADVAKALVQVEFKQHAADATSDVGSEVGKADDDEGEG